VQLLSHDEIAALAFSGTHRLESNVVDEPVPFSALTSVFSQTVHGGAGVCAELQLPHPCELTVSFTPQDDFGQLALAIELLTRLDHAVPLFSGHRMRVATPSSPYRLSARDLERAVLGVPGGHAYNDSDAEAVAAATTAATTALNTATQSRVQAMKKQLRDAAVLFGSNKHLRLQHARIGEERGVPFAHLRYDCIGNSDLHPRGEWETMQTILLQSLLQHGDVAVDVGSHIGTHTVALARAVGPRGLVHAFEVTSPLHDVLRANIALTGLSNVLTYTAAVGSVGDARSLWQQSQRAKGLDDRVAATSKFGVRIPMLDVWGPFDPSVSDGSVGAGAGRAFASARAT
jgi:predicted O-methyltransferase YrrM